MPNDSCLHFSPYWSSAFNSVFWSLKHLIWQADLCCCSGNIMNSKTKPSSRNTLEQLPKSTEKNLLKLTRALFSLKTLSVLKMEFKTVMLNWLGPISNLVYTDVIDIRSWLAVCLHSTSVPLAVTAIELKTILEYVLLYVIYPWQCHLANEMFLLSVCRKCIDQIKPQPERSKQTSQLNFKIFHWLKFFFVRNIALSVSNFCFNHKEYIGAQKISFRNG